MRQKTITKKRLSRHFFVSKKSRAGFTLIETLVYIALFGLIMGGVLMTVFQLLESSVALSGKTYVEGEANFVLRKISWALSSASSTVPSLPADPVSTLTVIRYDNIQVDICLDNSNPSKKVIKMREVNIGMPVPDCTDSSFLPLTTENVIVNNLQFQSIGSNPPGIAATTTLNGINFAISKYLRQ